LRQSQDTIGQNSISQFFGFFFFHMAKKKLGYDEQNATNKRIKFEKWLWLKNEKYSQINCLFQLTAKLYRVVLFVVVGF
jgi:hypothetical protein